MKRATIVIGANFGDEGKGLMTDYFVSQGLADPIVARFSGGANAGHTVVEPDGRRHVFSHFGSGTFAGAKTYLSREFVVNPALWMQEYGKLQGLNVNAGAMQLYVNKRAPLTLPSDMLINQAVENAMGEARHGSCGVGINETVTRNQDWRFRTKASDLMHIALLKAKMRHINTHWVADRCRARGFEGVPTGLSKMLADVEEKFLVACEAMRDRIILCGDGILDAHDDVIFEGSQGLMLDQDHYFFPHVTRAKTGIVNALGMAIGAKAEQVTAVYVTRPYLTRHGAGPLPGEDPSLTYADDTNVSNPFQGPLRFAPLDCDRLTESVLRDVGGAKAAYPGELMPDIKLAIALTHCDQVDGQVIQSKSAGAYRGGTFQNVAFNIHTMTGIADWFYSYGPTRGHVHSFTI